MVWTIQLNLHHLITIKSLVEHVHSPLRETVKNIFFKVLLLDLITGSEDMSLGIIDSDGKLVNRIKRAHEYRIGNYF
jgi:hypothetical protein